jgi:hypothetical protein
MTSFKATQIFGIILGLAFVLILTKPASADDYDYESDRGGNRQAYEDMKDFVYFAMDVKDAFFPSNQSETIVYDQRTYVNNETPKNSPKMEKGRPHKPKKDHNKPVVRKPPKNNDKQVVHKPSKDKKKPKEHRSFGDFKKAFDGHKR